MQPKSPRGVQQEDVSAAADALLAERVRPTIERVRQRLGRGSPNTVAPMLEHWFAMLGGRLGLADVPGTPPPLPTPVRQAAEALWLSALTTARDDAETALANERAALAADRVALHEAQGDLAARERALRDKQAAIEESLAIARGQAAELAARLSEVQAQLNRREAELTDARARLGVAERDNNAQRRAHDDELRALAEERSQMQERAAATERRQLQEIDRARQEARQVTQAYRESERRAAALEKEWQARCEGLDEQLRKSVGDATLLRQQLAAAEERATELRRLLDRQHSATAAALTRLAKPAVAPAKAQRVRRLRR